MMTKRLADYSLSELYDLQTQAQDLLATIAGEIADRTPPLYHQVCGYTESGELLPARDHHRFAVIQRSR